MHMISADALNAPIGFNEAWGALPFNIKLMLMHLWRAEQATAGAYARDEETSTSAALALPSAHRQSS